MQQGEWFSRTLAYGTFGGAAYGAWLAALAGAPEASLIAAWAAFGVIFGFGVGMVYGVVLGALHEGLASSDAKHGCVSVWPHRLIAGVPLSLSFAPGRLGLVFGVVPGVVSILLTEHLICRAQVGGTSDAVCARTSHSWALSRRTRHAGAVDDEPIDRLAPLPPGVRLHWAQPGDDELVLRCDELFDGPARPDWTSTFLSSPTHHLVIAMDGETPVGFISGVELTHPDKGVELFLYELGTHEEHRRQGIARALIAALVAKARERGCYDVFVGTEPHNEAAIAAYRDAGFAEPEPFVMLTLDLP